MGWVRVVCGFRGVGKSKIQGWRIGPLPKSKPRNTGTTSGQGGIF